MKIILYKMDSDNRVIGKHKVRAELGSHSANGFEVTLKEGTSIFNPTFILKYPLSDDLDGSNIIAKFDDINYLYCREWSRYYFIKDITFLTGRRIQLDCHVDVLESYKNDIANISAEIYRSEMASIKSDFMVDDRLPVECKRSVSRTPIGSVGDSVSYIVTVAGGEA